MRRLPARAWYLIYRAFAALFERAGTREAAQVAFWVMIAFPAALLLVLWAASTALDDPSVREKIVDGVIDAFPLSDEEGRSQVEELLDGVATGAGTLGVVGALALIWSASAAIGGLRHSIGESWPAGVPLPYFQGKALDVGMTLMIAPLMVAALGLNLLDVVPNALGDDPLLEGTVSFLLTIVSPAVALFCVFLVLYRFLPAAQGSWRAAWPGALVALLGTGLVRLGTEIYFGTVGDTGAIYGAVAGLLAVSISVYLLAIVAVLGANVAAEVAHQPNWTGVDEAIEADEGPKRSLGKEILELVRSLFLRRRRR